MIRRELQVAIISIAQVTGIPSGMDRLQNLARSFYLAEYWDADA